MMNKLKSKKGETLVETLAAILIFTMASIILYSMVTSASKINKKARDQDIARGNQLEVAEQAITQAGTGTVTMTMDIPHPGGSSSPEVIAQVPVTIFRNPDDKSLCSYFRTVPIAEGE